MGCECEHPGGRGGGKPGATADIALAHIYIHTTDRHTHTCTHIHTHIYIHTYVDTYVRTYIHTYIIAMRDLILSLH